MAYINGVGVAILNIVVNIVRLKKVEKVYENLEKQKRGKEAKEITILELNIISQ